MSLVDEKENLNPIKGFGQKRFPPMPKMEDDLGYHLTDAEEEEDDMQEEKKLMAILLKLTSAKENVTSSKKRKHCEKVVEEECVKYQKVVKDMLHKFHMKRSNGYKKMKDDSVLLLQDLKNIQNDYENNQLQYKHVIKKRKLDMEKIIITMSQALQRDIKQIYKEHTNEMQISIEYIKKQIEYKFEQLDVLINKSDTNQKEDKLSKMIQAVVAGL